MGCAVRLDHPTLSVTYGVVCDDRPLPQAAGDIGTSIFHPVGTCAMGPNPEDTEGGRAVVDARLRVYGLQGLRVVDASIMPSITSGPCQCAASL